jgi:hypothetical protein
MLAYSSPLLGVEFARSQFGPITTDGFADHAKFKIYTSFVSHGRKRYPTSHQLFGNKGIFDRLKSNTTNISLTAFKWRRIDPG